MLLSILIANLPIREQQLSELLSVLLPQIGKHKNTNLLFDKFGVIKYTSKDVEIVICTDNKEMTVGFKRNVLVDISKGKYVAHVDTDDMVSADYVSLILAGIKSNADVLNFQVMYYHNGSEGKKVLYDKKFEGNFNDADYYYRLPNHLMCFRRELATSTPYPDVSWGEDSVFALEVLPKINTQYDIPHILYHYQFNSETSETQRK